VKKIFLSFILISIIAIPLFAFKTVYEEDASINAAALSKTIKVYKPKDLMSVAIKFTNVLGVTLETSIMVLDPNGATKELDSTDWIAGEQEMIYTPPESGLYPLVKHNAQNNGIDRLLITTDKADTGNGVSIEVICVE